MSDEIINQKIKELDATTEGESVEPYIPVPIALQEAEELFDWCQNDKVALIDAGLDWRLVEDIPVRTAVLRLCQTKWSSEYKESLECQVEWKKAASLAYNLRDELVHHFYFILEDNPKEYAKVRRIDEGRSHADMIQDLTDLAELGRKHASKLKSIKFDMSLLDEAKTQSYRLSDLLARVNMSVRETSPQLLLRNKAYHHLKEAVDRIRHTGQYLYWKNPERLKGYASTYIRRKNKHRKRKKTSRK